jgi:FHS family Na+ dependent glucose MFS transporter 1
MGSSPSTPPPSASSGPPSFRRFVPYVGVFFVLGLAPGAIGPTLPALADQAGVTLKIIGFVFTSRMIGYTVMTFFVGRLIDGRSSHPLLAGALVAMALLMVSIPFLPSLGPLLTVFFLHGTGSALVDIGTNTLLLRTFRQRVGPFFNGLHFCFGAGAFLSPIFVAQALGRTGEALWAYVGIGVLTLPVGLWILRIPSPPLAPQASGRADAYPARWLMILSMLFFFLYAGVESGFSGWIYSYAIARGLASPETAAYLNSAFWGGLMIGRLLSVAVSARYRPRQILKVHLGWVVASIGVVTASQIYPFLIWIGTFSLGLAASTVFPTMLLFAERQIPFSGKVAGRFYLGASTGSMTLPLLIGYLFESFNPQMLLVTMGACALGAVTDLAILMRIWKK